VRFHSSHNGNNLCSEKGFMLKIIVRKKRNKRYPIQKYSSLILNIIILSYNFCDFKLILSKKGISYCFRGLMPKGSYFLKIRM